MRSLRTTFTLWYVGILAVILCLFSGALYVTVASSLRRDVQRTLILQADGVADALFSFWRAERSSDGSGPGNWLGAPMETWEGVINQGGLPAVVDRWAQMTAGLKTERLIRIADRQGEVLSDSDGFRLKTLPVTERAVAEALKGRTESETHLFLGQRYRLITRPIMEAKRVLYVVQTAMSLQPMDASLARLRLWLLILIPTALGTLNALSMLLIAKAFGPIGRLIAKAKGFVEEYAHESLDVPQTADELQRLTVTFDEMLARMERAFRRLHQFSAAASHELRTPLTVMKGEIGLALRKPRSAQEYRRVLQTNLDVINEMADIVEELLALGRRQAATAEVEQQAVEMGELAQHALQRLHLIATSKSVELAVTVADPVWVRGNRRLLERLLANLLDNAIRHTPASGRVTVSVAPRGQAAVIIVRDTGPGIAPEDLPHLFDRFFKPRQADDGHSTGLGLGLCRWIAEAHRGAIDVASQPGHGATFTVRLPASAPPA